MKFIAYMRCSTCIKALKYLNDLGINIEVVDIKTNNPTALDLKKYHENSKLDISKFFNTSGKLYKELNLKDKLKEMTLEEKYDLLATDGMLVKRPLLVTKDKVLVGFKTYEYDELIN